MNIIAIIPARMGSTRFPGKPMAKISGKPMIEHVYQRVLKCSDLTYTVVATCDMEIYDHIKLIGGNAIMTKDIHERASDRCAEALIKVEKELNIKFDIVVMIQGDEPLIEKDMINEAISPMLKDKNIKVVNLIGKIEDETEFNDRNCIKVVCDQFSNALYFSREPIPINSYKTFGKQVCVIPFRRDYLIEYTNLPATPLEKIESIDMLRILENGEKIKMVPTKFSNQSVDTLDDLLKVEKILKNQL
jgi:3-deoxy-manno-octulosonate cytidylyltransferase (CMP-KDO synthetase)